MYVKKDKNGNVVSMFLYCVPEQVEEYELVPDDVGAMEEFKRSRTPAPSGLEADVAELRGAIEALVGGVTE